MTASPISPLPAGSTASVVQIIRPSPVAGVLWLLAILAFLLSQAPGGPGFWKHPGLSGSGGILAIAALLAIAWIAFLIYDRKSFTRRVTSHPAALTGGALFAGACFIYRPNARQEIGLIFLTPEKLILDLRTRYRNETFGSQRNLEIKLARITRIEATRRALKISRDGLDDLSIRVHDPRRWRSRIEQLLEEIHEPR